MNDVCLKGNLVRDPEVKEVTGYEGKTTHVANFTVAVSRYFKRANGEKDKDTTFIPCEAWDTGAETLGKYCHKGDPILVKGSIKMESWENKDGDKRSRLKVRVSTFDRLYRAPKSDDNGGTYDASASNDAPDDTADKSNEPF